MTVSVILDSSVLSPTPLSETLLRMATASLIVPYFSQAILDDTARHITGKKKNKETASKYLRFIVDNFPEALKEVDSHVCESMTNHHSKKHVLAAAISPPHCNSIVTFYTDHFKPEDIQRWDVTAITPDSFLCSLCEEEGDQRVFEVVDKQARELVCPRISLIELLDKLHKKGVPEFSNRMTGYRFQRVVTQIAKRTLNTVGKLEADGARVFNGDLYFLKSHKDTFQIIRKEEEKIILESVSSTEHFVDISPKDVMRFCEFDKELNKKLRQSQRAVS